VLIGAIGANSDSPVVPRTLEWVSFDVGSTAFFHAQNVSWQSPCRGMDPLVSFRRHFTGFSRCWSQSWGAGTEPGERRQGATARQPMRQLPV